MESRALVFIDLTRIWVLIGLAGFLVWSMSGCEVLMITLLKEIMKQKQMIFISKSPEHFIARISLWATTLVTPERIFSFSEVL